MKFLQSSYPNANSNKFLGLPREILENIAYISCTSLQVPLQVSHLLRCLFQHEMSSESPHPEGEEEKEEGL